jgi:hypothetical protein
MNRFEQIIELTPQAWSPTNQPLSRPNPCRLAQNGRVGQRDSKEYHAAR